MTEFTAIPQDATPLRPMTDEELAALLAQTPMIVTTDDTDEAEVAVEAPAPTLQ